MHRASPNFHTHRRTPPSDARGRRHRTLAETKSPARLSTRRAEPTTPIM
ncbi:hypothetical protein [Candidatus Burkholderia verschuerenii]|nr:hypothetical protein [Candidatus Burkholderia verschuerenii]